MSTPEPKPPATLPIFIGQVQGGARALRIACATFPNGRIAVYLASELSMYCRWAVNLPEFDIDVHEFFAKTYDENEALREPMLATGLFVDTGLRAEGGFVDLELWKFTPRGLELLAEHGVDLMALRTGG